MEEECQRLRGVQPQVMSVIYLDNQGKPVFAYCAHRPDEPADPPIQVFFLAFSNPFLIDYCSITYIINTRAEPWQIWKPRRPPASLLVMMASW
jgi:hypothetical protein